jgi:hypothetical protein
MNEQIFNKDSILNIFHISFINKLVNLIRSNNIRNIYDEDIWRCFAGLEEMLYLKLSEFKSLNTQETSLKYFYKCNAEIKYFKIGSNENEFIQNFCIALKDTKDTAMLSKNELKVFAKAFKKYCQTFNQYKDLNKLVEEEIAILKDEIELFRLEKEKTENTENAGSKFSKLKTNLSVDQLCFLFRMLKELKPDLFNIKANTELYDFIASSFETKKQTDLSPNSIKNHMTNTTPDPKNVLDFWEEHLLTMLADLRKLK